MQINFRNVSCKYFMCDISNKFNIEVITVLKISVFAGIFLSLGDLKWFNINILYLKLHI